MSSDKKPKLSVPVLKEHPPNVQSLEDAIGGALEETPSLAADMVYLAVVRQRRGDVGKKSLTALYNHAGRSLPEAVAAISGDRVPLSDAGVSRKEIAQAFWQSVCKDAPNVLSRPYVRYWRMRLGV